MLKKSFISNVQIILLLNILVKPIWIFFIDKNVQLTVGHSEYGLYNALMSLTIIFNILLDFGMTNYNNKSIAENNALIKKSLPNLIIAKSILSFLYFGIVFLIALLFQYQGRALEILGLLAIVQFFNSFLQFLRSNISANHDFVMDGVLSVLDKMIMIGICGVLLYSSSFKGQFIIEWMIYAQMTAYIIAIIFAFIVIVKKYTVIQFNHFSFKEMIDLCKKSLPYAVLILFMGIYMRSDTLMLERLESAAQNGLYASANRLLDVANMTGFLFAGILLPMFARLISNKGNINEIIVTSANVLLPVSLGVVAFSFMYSHEIMYWLYKDNSEQLSWVFRMVMACFPAYCIMYIYSTLLTANGNIKLLIAIAISGSILSVGLNWILIIHYQALGAAITAFVVEWILAALYIIYCIRKFSLPVNSKWIIQFAIFFILMCTLNFALKSINCSLYWSMAINLPVFVAMVYGFKFWDKKLLMSYFKQ